MGQGKKLAYYVEKQGFAKKSFCEINSLEYNSMVMIMAEKRVIGINVLNRIHEILPKLNVHSKIEDTMIYVHIAESVTDIEILNLDTILNN